MSEQLILNVNLKDDATFENFFLQKGSENAVAVEVLQKQLLSQKNSFVYLWGGTR
jgi:DnaA family protein